MFLARDLADKREPAVGAVSFKGMLEYLIDCAGARQPPTIVLVTPRTPAGGPSAYIDAMAQPIRYVSNARGKLWQTPTK